MSQENDGRDGDGAYPGAAPPAAWFLRPSGTPASPGAAGTGPDQTAGEWFSPSAVPPGEFPPIWHPAADAAEGGPRQLRDTGGEHGEPGSSGTADYAADRAGEQTGDAWPAGQSPAPAADRARRGWPGGPGFQPAPAGAGNAGLSQWQILSRLWDGAPGPRVEGPPADGGRLPAGGWPGEGFADHPGAPRARAWRGPSRLPSGRHTFGQPGPDGTLLLGAGRHSRPPRVTDGRGIAGRRAGAVAVPVVVLLAVAVLALALATGNGPKTGQLAANQGATGHSLLAPAGITGYTGQQQRGVFQSIGRVAAWGNTIVAIGSQTSDGLERQQFFVSADAGATWQLAPVHGPGGGQPPFGYAAVRVAGGPAGWVAVGPQATWTSPDGKSWTLAATHGIAPQLPGDQMLVLNGTARGFLAAGAAAAGDGASQAVIWTSRDGLTWQRETAAQLGLAGPGQTAQGISYITSRGDATLISGTVAAGGRAWSGSWLSTDGGSAWTRVAIPVDHGAAASIAGLGFDGSGLIAVRPGRALSGAGDGIAYFSPDGRSWQYAATINASRGWDPALVKGSEHGFVVSGTSASGEILAYVSTGTGTAWRPTAPLGDASVMSLSGATAGSGESVIAVGSMAGSKTGQLPVFLEADAAGRVRLVPLLKIPGAVVPELAVSGLAASAGQQVAAGSADGYPAVWRKAGGGSWALVSPLAQVSGTPGLGTLTGVAHGTAGWLAAGDPGPVVMTSADGTAWQAARGPGSIAGDLAGVSAVAVAAGRGGYVIAGELAVAGGGYAADVWWSPDLATWTRARDVNDANGSNQVLAVAAAARGFVSAGSHDGKPAVWTTADGRNWTAVVLPVPPGASAAGLQRIAVSGDRVTALGQATTAAGTVPIAEYSADGGASWQQVPFRSPGTATAFTALAAGPAGFTAAGLDGVPGQRQAVLWTSASGTAWVQSGASGLTGMQGGSYQITALASSGSAVTGIGTVAAQQSQKVFTVLLPAR